MLDSLTTYAQENSSGGSGLAMIWFILGAIGLYKMFEKAGEAGWIGIVPFYRDLKIADIAMGNPLYYVKIWIAMLFPGIGTILALYWKFQVGKAIAQSYGKPEAWAWGYTLFDSVFFLLTGIDDSSYYGIYGRSDSRTGEARSARTVNYDVIKNEPEPQQTQDPSEVEFDFNQDVGD